MLKDRLRIFVLSWMCLLDSSGKAFLGQTLWLITKARKLQTKKLYDFGLRSDQRSCLLRYGIDYYSPGVDLFLISFLFLFQVRLIDV